MESRNWCYRSFFSKLRLRSTIMDLGGAIELPRSTDAQDVSTDSPTVTLLPTKWGFGRGENCGVVGTGTGGATESVDLTSIPSNYTYSTNPIEPAASDPKELLPRQRQRRRLGSSQAALN
ncbi:hypothetical protein F0562_018368 [Nyssa sinensis]|uniref:Uncharacterized protein n=1 Tax=Nyssa sinensis TaxID=561372 RepID=A0A5J4ZBF0_9ASTE|nr:hypothetical protein F0562_018368 [Nyssa sinensis]